jgi:hypothetical protein
LGINVAKEGIAACMDKEQCSKGGDGTSSYYSTRYNSEDVATFKQDSEDAAPLSRFSKSRHFSYCSMRHLADPYNIGFPAT